MTDNNKLYFIPILIKALAKDNQIEELKDALNEIKNLGAQAIYKEGYEQFEQFIISGYEQNKNFIKSQLNELIVKLITNEIELSKSEKEKIVNDIKSNYKTEFEQIFQTFKNKNTIDIEVYKDGPFFTQIEIDEKIKEYYITNIEPGKYEFKLSNGRKLLEQNIIKEQIILNLEDENIKYNLAAETDEIEKPKCTSFDLIKDEIKLEVYPGLEYGKFKILIE